jgi:hypothetical protein
VQLAPPPILAIQHQQIEGEEARGAPSAPQLPEVGPALLVLRYVEHLEHGGAEMFEHACRLGLEGIVWKRGDGRYRSGRSSGWLKIKNPDYERA